MASPVTDYFIHPLPNPDLADGFGSTGFWEGGEWVKRAHPHRGLDYAHGVGTPIRAVAHGEVVRAFWSDELGKVTVIRHNRPGSAPDVFSGYCHQEDVGVHVGQVVERGQTIGAVGDSGSAAAGAHLHLTMSHYDDGVEGPRVTFNPAIFIEANDRQTLGDAVKPKTVKVRKGDSLSRIAERYGITLTVIKRLNPAVKPPAFVIQVGQKVRVR